MLSYIVGRTDMKKSVAARLNKGGPKSIVDKLAGTESLVALAAENPGKCNFEAHSSSFLSPHSHSSLAVCFPALTVC